MTRSATKPIPREINLTCPVQIKATGVDGKPRRPAFNILGYTGALVRAEGSSFPLIFSLSGIRAARAKLPCLRDHDHGRVLGTTTEVAVGKDGVRLSGLFTADSPDTREVLEHSANGFEWQASMGINFGRTEFLKSGEKARVNNRDVIGPAIIVTKSTIKEISILSLGADGDTSVSIAARARKGAEGMDGEEMTTETVDPMTAERDRISAIKLAGRQATRPGLDRVYTNLINQAITSGADPEDFAITLLRQSTTLPPPQPSSLGGRGYGSPDASAKDQLTAMTLAMAGRTDLVLKMKNGEQLANSVELPGGWVELCAESLRMSHVDPPRERHEMVKLALFSSVGLPSAIGLGVEKIALDVFLEGTESWRGICRIINATNFREGKAIRLAAASKLLPLPRGGEIKHGTVAEDSFSYKLGTYARMFALTREDIIDDDLGILNDLPVVIGNEAARTCNDLFVETLLANAGNFFSVGNSNLIDDELDVEGLGEAARVIRTAKDNDGRVIGLVPQVLLVPAAKEQLARQLLNSQLLSRAAAVDNAPTGNPVQGLNLTLAVEPRLDDASVTAWYMFAQPRHGAVLAAFLNGQLGVRVENEPMPFERLGIQYRGVMDCAFALGEDRAAVKSSGDETP